MGNSFVVAPSIRKISLSKWLILMVKLSFPTHFRNAVSNISHCLYRIPQFLLTNALSYSIMKLSKNMNRTKLTKTIKTHIYVHIFILFMYGSVLKSRPINISHMLQECSKKQNLSNKTSAFLSKSGFPLIGNLMKSCIKSCMNHKPTSNRRVINK